ncbi:thioredoxin domain-containing protein [Nonlabens sp.]|uniref:thioredoxin family protein n=1 Tax=Nonlabens sp. TaxID=1888209 RepID=UPI0025E3DE88|nr:thioredoxin domain-containing protein [Nonlabens sp.]
MRILFIITFSLLSITASFSQEYVTDASMEETVMVKDDQIKVLYFTAPWCGPCNYMAPVIKSISEDERIDVTIYKMNTDDNTSDDILKVSSIPTYFFIKNGRKLGQSSSVMRRDNMVELIKKHDAMKVKGGLLPYRGTPSNYEIVAGAHEKLTKKNLEQLWHSAQELNELSWNIYKNLKAPKDLACALTLVNRSIELEENTYNLQTKAHVLYQMKDHKKALQTAQKAKKQAARNASSTTIIEELIKKIEAE